MEQTLIRALQAPITKSAYYHRYLESRTAGQSEAISPSIRAMGCKPTTFLVTLRNKTTTERTVYPRGGQLQMFYGKLTDSFRGWVGLNGILTDVYKSLRLMSLNKTASRLGTGELGTTQGRS